jgi:Cyclin, N-terminal domain
MSIQIAMKESSWSCEGPSTVEVLRKQEMSSYYQCHDYLASCSNQQGGVTAAIRAEMLEWACKVTDFLKFTASGDDIAVLTATLLDRFLQTPQGTDILTNVPSFRCATMGCFYLVAKVHADHSCYTVSADVMAAMSRGQFSAQQVEDMEMLILTSMKWHINPPTALTFVTEFLHLLPPSVSESTREQTYQLCQAQIQRSILDYQVFALTEASSIAFFAVHNALRSLGMDEILLEHVCAIFSYATHTSYSSRRCGEHFQAALLTENAIFTIPSSSSNNKVNKSTSSISKRSTTTKELRHSRHYRRFYRPRIDSTSLSPCGVVLEATAA